jgi:glucose-1-phosphate cytidylyltransferase
MKAVLLAGGLGTRITEESYLKPKPMIEIGGKPLLWHIMKIYSHYGINEFIICAGYKGYLIKEYFANYFLHQSDVTFDIASNRMKVHHNSSEPWKVTVVDTGEHTMTGGRLKRIRKYVEDDTFCMTYGDGVSDINIQELLNFHKLKNTKATVAGVCPPLRFGSLDIDNSSLVNNFEEKPTDKDRGWINGGFFVLEPSVLDLISGDECIWEREPMQYLAAAKQLSAFKHQGFWQPMDTLRDKLELDKLWETARAPWKVWDTEPATLEERSSIKYSLNQLSLATLKNRPFL